MAENKYGTQIKFTPTKGWMQSANFCRKDLFLEQIIYKNWVKKKMVCNWHVNGTVLAASGVRADTSHSPTSGFALTPYFNSKSGHLFSEMLMLLDKL